MASKKPSVSAPESLVDDSFITSIVISVALTLFSLSTPYKTTFWFVPPVVQGWFGGQVTIADNLLVNQYALILYVLGFIALIVVPPVILGKTEGLFTKRQAEVFLASALAYAASAIIIKLSNMANFGDPFISYLFDKPVYIFTEFLVPAYYVLIWYRKRPAKE